MATATTVSQNDFSQHVLQADGPVLVDFYADWCSPCRALAPVLDQFAADNPLARVVKVNVDDSQQLANQYQVQSIPTLMVFRDGRPVARHVGLADKQQLEAMLTG